MKKLILILAIGFVVGCDSGTVSTKSQKSKMKVPVAENQAPVLPTISQKILKVNGEDVHYTIRVPGDYSKDKPVPLIVALHYGGRVTPWYGRGMIEALIEPGLSELNAIVIAPDSQGGGWNTQQNDTAVIQLMDHVEKEYAIDKKRTLLTGFSMGGHGTFHFGGRHQDRFRAAIPIAARPAKVVSWNIPLYVIHSKADKRVPIEPTRDYVKKLKGNGADVTMVEVEDLPHFHTARFAEPLKQAIPWIKKVWEN